METAPKDRRIDIVAKRYNPQTDAFVLRRFTDCYWFEPHPSAKTPAHFHGVPPEEYRPVCWMEPPALEKLRSVLVMLDDLRHQKDLDL